MAIRRWNATCVEHGLMLMPVVLDRMRGEIGPIVIPKETACYECLRARENANLTDPVKERLAEQAAVVGQIRNTFHGAMAGAVAEFAALEIAKLLSGAMLPKMGAFTTLALLEPSLQTRYVLKVPRCRVCSPMLWRPAPNLENRAFWNRVMDKAKRV
jgi:bacteriocin biosynthesis cyclodehydratase domain-containing protein